MPYKKGTPKYYYHNQKVDAKRRGIAWEFTFETWMKVWEDSGKWNQRGCNEGQYVMSRHNDVGPYSLDNVSIVLCGKNNRDGMKKWRTEKKARENGTNGLQSDQDRAAPQAEATLDANEFGLAARTFIEIGRKYQAA